MSLPSSCPLLRALTSPSLRLTRTVHLLLSWPTLAFLSVPAAGFAAESSQPNIVVILADDLGVGALNCYGAPTRLVRTPNIDRLAREGIRFTQAYTPSSLCTPTRYGMLTGRYCWRSSLKSGLVAPLDPLLIEPTRPTLASLLRRTGYATGIIGKWHLGFGTTVRDSHDLASPLSPGPRQLGFDYYFGLPQNHGEPWGIYAENETVWGLRSANHVEYPKPSYYGARFMGFDAPQRDDWTAQAVLTDHAVDWIGQQSPAKPFFLYFATAAIHEPVTPGQAARGSGAGLYGDWVQDLDLSVGRILDALKRSGFDRNTLVIFTSDNGAVRVESPTKAPPPYTPLLDVVWDAQQHGLSPNGQFRGKKGGIYEGGFRVPFVALWPDRIPAAVESQERISLVDLMATIAELVHGPSHETPAVGEDSISFLPALLAKPAARPGRETLILHSGNGTFAVVKGRWKWIEGLPAPQPGRTVQSMPEEIYDLAADPGERSNLRREHPEIAKELRAALNAVRGEDPRTREPADDAISP